MIVDFSVSPSEWTEDKDTPDQQTGTDTGIGGQAGGTGHTHTHTREYNIETISINNT